MTIHKNKFINYKPTLLKHSCLQCGRYTPIYDYCEYCIQPLNNIDNKTTICNYCKESFSCLVDGHCITCHQNLKNNRINLIIDINKLYINYIKNKIGLDNWSYLVDYFNTINNNGQKLPIYK